MDTADLADATAVLVARLRDTPTDRWDEPTPCPDWTVRQLVHHLVFGTDRFIGRFGVTPTPVVPADDAPPEQLLDAYEQATTALVGVFREPGRLQQVLQLPIGPVSGQTALDLRVVETITHGWDITQAWGISMLFDPDLVDRAIAFSGPAIERIPEGRSPFGTPQPAPEGADAQDRLAALLGRQPASST